MSKSCMCLVIIFTFSLIGCGDVDFTILGSGGGGGDAPNPVVTVAPNPVETVAPLPDTGQINCYDELGVVISCAGTGQDGEYSIKPPSFTHNGDGTVTDNVTGLVWQQADDDNTYTWQEALEYCENLSLGNNPNAIWRLPSRRELFSIINFSYTSPAIDNTVFLDVTHRSYWSSSTNGTDSTKAGTVNSSGGAGSYPDKSNTYAVRCVH